MVQIGSDDEGKAFAGGFVFRPEDVEEEGGGEGGDSGGVGGFWIEEFKRLAEEDSAGAVVEGEDGGGSDGVWVT